MLQITQKEIFLLRAEVALLWVRCLLYINVIAQLLKLEYHQESFVSKWMILDWVHFTFVVFPVTRAS